VKVKREILELRETLAKERSKKKNKEEYLALARLIHDLPKRTDSDRCPTPSTALITPSTDFHSFLPPLPSCRCRCPWFV